jgi:ornithine carbamoyltransferase
MNFTGRHFLKEVDFTQAELAELIDMAAALKADRAAGREVQRLRGRTIALIFELASTRTRSAFEVAAYHQGANVTYFDPTSAHIGDKEVISDTAAVLSRMYDAIQFRGNAQSTVEALAASSRVPVYNGLTHEWHPLQMLADFLTMREHSGKAFTDISYAYLGDARSNMGNSLLAMGAIMGSDVRICSPEQLWPSDAVQSLANDRAAASGAQITMTEDPAEALPGVDFVITDVWVSMGESPEEWERRIALLHPYQVNRAALDLTGNPDVKFMHCLPAFHDMNTRIGREIAESNGMRDGLEVTDEVFHSTASVVFDEAENRLHTTKAVMVATIGD